jgi:hypothetical protein
MSIHPPFYDEHGPAPAGVCSRWMGDSPCGSAAAYHVIWDYDMINGAVCREHAAEARERWVFIGLHPYTAACGSAGAAVWLPDEDRCMLPGDSAQSAAAAVTVSQVAP